MGLLLPGLAFFVGCMAVGWIGHGQLLLRGALPNPARRLLALSSHGP
jgi:hypothetical protein